MSHLTEKPEKVTMELVQTFLVSLQTYLMIHFYPHPFPVRVIKSCMADHRDPKDRELVTPFFCDAGEEFEAIAIVGGNHTIVKQGNTELEIPTENIARIGSFSWENKTAV